MGRNSEELGSGLTFAPSRAPLEMCVMAPSKRSNCGFNDITPAQCAAKGCCFDSTVPGYPWCFYPLNIVNNVPEGTSMTTWRG